MKHWKTKIRTPYISVLLILAAAIVISCEKKIDTIPKSDLLSRPSSTGEDVKTIYRDSGLIQLELTAPLMEQYTNTNVPYYEFRKGLKVLFYDGKKDPVASVTSKYAKYTESDNLWELKDSVVVINDKNEKLETELLFWDQKKDLIFTDRFVKISSPTMVSQGFGFESDSHLRNREIKKVSATIYLDDEK